MKIYGSFNGLSIVKNFCRFFHFQMSRLARLSCACSRWFAQYALSNNNSKQGHNDDRNTQSQRQGSSTRLFLASWGASIPIIFVAIVTLLSRIENSISALQLTEEAAIPTHAISVIALLSVVVSDGITAVFNHTVGRTAVSVFYISVSTHCWVGCVADVCNITESSIGKESGSSKWNVPHQRFQGLKDKLFYSYFLNVFGFAVELVNRLIIHAFDCNCQIWPLTNSITILVGVRYGQTGSWAGGHLLNKIIVLFGLFIQF